MAMLSPGPSRSRGNGALSGLPMSEINVTPLVDVMLVLLIIFMVTAPLVSAGVNVDLPRNHAKQIVSDQKPVEISIDASGQIFIGDGPVPREQFGTQMQQLARETEDPANLRIFIRADKGLGYGYVMGVVSEISSAGITKVAFLSDPRPDGTRG